MADVTEVIHKISYEVNDDALNNATKAIHTQIAELDELTRKLNTYQRQMTRLADGEVRKLDDLSRKIDDVNRKIAGSASKLEGIFKQVGNGILDGIGANGRVEDAVEKMTGNIIKQFKEIKKFDFKNIAKLATNLFSFTNIAPLAISFLIDIAAKLFNTSEAAKEADSSYADFLETLKGNRKSSLRAIDEQVGDARLAINTVNDNTLPEQNRRGAAEQLKSKYASVYQNYDIDDIVAGRASSANNNLLTQIKHYEESRLIQKNIVAAKEQIRDAEEKELDLLKKKTEAQRKYEERISVPLSNKDSNLGEIKIRQKLAEAKAQYEQEYNDVRSRRIILQKIIAKGDKEVSRLANLSPDLSFPYVEQPETKANTHATIKPKPGEAPEVELKLKIDTEYNEKAIEEYVQEIKKASENKLQEGHDKQIRNTDDRELNDLIGLEERYKNDKLTFEEYEKEKLEIADRYKELRLKKELEYLQSLQLIYQQDAEKREALLLKQKEIELELKRLQNKKNNTDDENEEEKAAELRKQRRQEAISEFQNLAEAAVEAYNTISEAQIKALDKEISIREKRVENARKLAERGNAEALRLEEERLEEAQRKRDQIAKRQASVNAALAVSNSLVAVTGAIASAVKGDGYSLAARVAAAIAAVLGALSAGYAFVQSFSDDADSFATGVVDYKGKGGPRDDSNWVRISSGESVITAEGTQKNRALLEAINNGTAFQMLDTSLPLLMPSFKQPSVVNHNYATTQEMKGLEHKLDDVVNAIEDNKLRQNIFFNEQGVGIMTERAMNRNRKRWM